MVSRRRCHPEELHGKPWHRWELDRSSSESRSVSMFGSGYVFLLAPLMETQGKLHDTDLFDRFTGLKRCGKSCRLRWLNYLRPDIKHGGFTEEEDSIICSLYFAIGSRQVIDDSDRSGQHLFRVTFNGSLVRSMYLTSRCSGRTAIF